MARQTCPRRSGLGRALLVLLSIASTCALHAVGVSGLGPPLAAAQSTVGDQPQADPERDAEEARRAMDMFLRREKLLFRQGEGSLELDAFYATDKGTDFVSLDDTRELVTITTQLVSWSVIARYGLIDNLELDLIIPFGYAEQEIDLGFARSRTDDFGLGDIAGRLRYQVWQERGASPDIILDFDVKSRSGGDTLLGSGHWSVGGSFTLVKTLDPVVFFGRLGYLFTLERDGRDPGNQIFYELGMGFSLNDRVSFNMRLDGAAVGRFEVDGSEIPGSSLDILSLQFAVTTRVSRNWFVEPQVRIGLSNDASDAVAGVNVVYRFWRSR
jgi:Putative MetA-pathway of phenol degradation